MIEKTRRTTRIELFGRSIVSHPRVLAVVNGFVQRMEAHMRTEVEIARRDLLAWIPVAAEDGVAELAQGEQWRMTPRKRKRLDVIEQKQRIEAALRAGEATSSIAAREGVSARHVFRIKAQLVAAVEVE